MAPSGAIAAAPPGSSREDRRLYAAMEVVEQAATQVERDRPCRPRPNRPKPTDARPSTAVLQRLAPLRRAQEPEEREALNVLGPSSSRAGTAVSYGAPATRA